ncbi:MAG: hypothetical protein IT243_09235 [Bacteroidia bacterium]|nr:hypothetical protein [Bacteroidia bacterium]
MNILKIIKTAIITLVLIVILDSCAANRNSLKGCDGNKKTKVPFGYM